MAAPTALILRAPGTNCDAETAFAFERAGALVEWVHVNQLRTEPKRLRKAQIFVLPGGFSYGDDVAAGKILASRLELDLADAVREFRNAEKLVLGICNGFQALLRAGLIVPPDDDGPLATLAPNDHGRFEDRWIRLGVASDRCPFLKGMTGMHVPIAHGEGRFACRERWILKGLAQTGQIVLRYVDGAGQTGHGFPMNPNGSEDDAAGVCDATGRVLGLMPHPERHLLATQAPDWTRRGATGDGDGMKLFRNAVEYFK